MESHVNPSSHKDPASHLLRKQKCSLDSLIMYPCLHCRAAMDQLYLWALKWGRAPFPIFARAYFSPRSQKYSVNMWRAENCSENCYFGWNPSIIFSFALVFCLLSSTKLSICHSSLSSSLPCFVFLFSQCVQTDKNWGKRRAVAGKHLNCKHWSFFLVSRIVCTLA